MVSKLKSPVFYKKVQIFFLLLSIFILACAAACTPDAKGSPYEAQDNSFSKVLLSGVLTVGVDDTFAPMSFRDEDGALVGYDIELMTAMLQSLGLRAEFVVFDANDLPEALSNGLIHCAVSGTVQTEKNKTKMLFSAPYVRSGYGLAVHENSPYHRLEDLAGKKIGIRRAAKSLSSFDEQDWYRAAGEIKEYQTTIAQVVALESIDVDAVLIDFLSVHDFNTRQNKTLRLLPYTLAPADYRIAFNNTDESLKEEISKALQALKNTETINQVSRKWFDKNISVIGKLNR